MVTMKRNIFWNNLWLQFQYMFPLRITNWDHCSYILKYGSCIKIIVERGFKTRTSPWITKLSWIRREAAVKNSAKLYIDTDILTSPRSIHSRAKFNIFKTDCLRMGNYVTLQNTKTPYKWWLTMFNVGTHYVYI